MNNSKQREREKISSVQCVNNQFQNYHVQNILVHEIKLLRKITKVTLINALLKLGE